MKPILKLMGLLLLLVIYTTINAQSAAQKRVLVYFKTGVQRNAPPNQNTVTITSSNVSQLLSNYGLNASNITPSFPNFNEADTVNTEIGESSRQMNYAKVFAISLPDTSFKSSLINSLLNLSEVLYAESDGDVTNSIIPIDPQFGQQWNMRNTVVPGADIHLDGATNIFTGNPIAVIAIIDAGVDVNHNDLNAKINGGDNGFLIQNNPLVGDFSHGSHVAGIAAAVSNNNDNNGVAGVDWEATIHSRFVIGNNSGDAGITQGINAALNFGPDVWTFNNSWGLIQGIDGFGNAIPGRYSVTVRSAFANVYRNNRVSCVAMGNHQVYSGGIYANQVAFPAGFNTGLIAVGATDINDGIGNFSAQGAHIDVSAPGVNILSTNFNNGYVVLSGTSMASPHVSGLASLLRGFNTNLANDDIEQIIRLSSDDANAANGFPGFDNQMGAGRINAERALQSLQAPNQLLHWSITGGTIVNTSGNQTRIFLGVPGFADAAYVVRRSEVRTNVIFPTGMCTIIGAWGRGVGTTGLREEQGRCFGEGICEIVPGTLTNTGATLRTWIYEVWGINGQYYGFFPQTANNVVFQYTVLGVPRPTAINGDNSFCTTSNNYTIPNLPLGATIQWLSNPSGIVTINSPNSPQTTLTRNTDGTITLTAVISNVCGEQIILTKSNIGVGNPTISGYYVIFSNYHSQIQRPLYNNNSPIWLPANKSFGVYALITGTNFQSASWTRAGNSYPFTWSSSGPSLNFSGFSGSSAYNERDGIFIATSQNSCGQTTGTFIWPVIVQGWSFTISTNPNPATDNLTVSIEDESTEVKALSKNEDIIMTLYDLASTVVIKRWAFKNNQSKFNLDVSNIKSGQYVLVVNINKYQQSKQITIE